MTHEELLAKIKGYANHDTALFAKTHKLCVGCDNGYPVCTPCKVAIQVWFTNALLAVVELHKPDNAGFCSECFGTPYVTYPCSTIQAIEKELNA